MLITIEGVDRVGKTTIAREVSKIIGFNLIEKPLKSLIDNYDLLSKKINEEGSCALRTWFYGTGLIYLSNIARDKNIITTRYFLSNYAWNLGRNKESFNALIKLIDKPDWTFLLTAREEVIKKRLIKRCPTDKDISKIDIFEEQVKRMKECLNLYDFPYSIIDTSDISIKDECEIIINTIKKLKGVS